MAADSSPVQTVEAPPLKPIVLPAKLAGTPRRAPRHAVEVRGISGSTARLADPRAVRSLVALMDVHAVVGGAACHWGGPAAMAEMMSAIHGLMFAVEGRPWHEAFNFANDAGHTENGVYAVRTLYGFDGLDYEALEGFRAIHSKLTGHGESHLNPEGVYLSNGPLGSALPQAQGLAMGDKLAGNDRVTVCTVSDGAAMEGEAREAFAAIPGLAAKGHLNPFVLVVSDNNTKLSGRISKDAFSMRGTFEALAPLGWNVMQVENGHDLEAVYQALERALEAARANPQAPVALWVNTVKGYGIKATEDDASGGHGFPLKDGEKILDWLNELWAGQPPVDLLEWGQRLRTEWERKKAAGAPAAPAGPKTLKIQAGLSKAAIRAAQEGMPVVCVSSDLAGSTGMGAFAKTFPERSFDVGVAEANMVSVGAGLSKQGFLPIVDTFAQFGITKGNLPLTMAALSQAPVIAVFSHTGFQDAADGASHQATTYFAAVSAIPHTQVVCCSCAGEAEALFYQAIAREAQLRRKGRTGDNVIFFVGRENYPMAWQEGAEYEWGKAQVLRRGADVTLLASGPLVGQALEAAGHLAARGKSATVIHNAFVNRIDIETIGDAVQATKGRLVTLEDHQVTGGAGAQVVQALVNVGMELRARLLGIPGIFGQSAYAAEELYRKHGMTAHGYLAAAAELGV
jgi:transketolase